MIIKHVNPKNPKQFFGAHAGAAVEFPDGGISYGPDYIHTPKRLRKDEIVAERKPMPEGKAKKPAKKAAAKKN